MSSQEQAFRLAYRLLASLDEALTRGLHLRASDGKLINKFDQLLVAIEAGRWPGPESETKKCN